MDPVEHAVLHKPFPQQSPLDLLYPPRQEVRAAKIPECFKAAYARLRRRVDAQPAFVAGQLNYQKILAVLHRRAPHINFDEILPEIPVRVSREVFDEGALLAQAQFLSGRAAPATSSLLADAHKKHAWEYTEKKPLHLSPQFVAHQDTKDRLIFDLRGINRYTRELTFNLDTIQDLPLLFRRARYLSKADLTSGFWQVPVADPGLFGFVHPDGRYATWNVLPFGWSLAPRTFQALTAAFVRAWRECGVIASVYLDDFLWGGDTIEVHLRATTMIIEDLIDAGLVLSPKKTSLEPHDALLYLGVAVDAEFQTLAIPLSKREKIIAFARQALSDGRVREGELKTFLGRSAFCRIVAPQLGFFTGALHRLSSKAADRPIPTTARAADTGAVLEHTPGDLFEVLAHEAAAGNNWSLAHCASADLAMGRGVAAKFRERYGMGLLAEQRVTTPGCAAMLNNKDYDVRKACLIYVLITKERFYEKPSYDSLRSALRVCRDMMLKNHNHNLMFPLLGCGRDQLMWSAPDEASDVRRTLLDVFNERPPTGVRWRLRLVDNRSTTRDATGAIELDDDATADLQVWAEHANRLMRRPRPWVLLHQTRAWLRRHGEDFSIVRLTGLVVDTDVLRQDASETGVGLATVRPDRPTAYRAEPFPQFLMDWLRRGDVRASSTARELYGIARNLATHPARAGTVLRSVCDNAGSTSTARGIVPAAGTTWAAKYLAAVAEEQGVFLATEWAPREELDDVDGESRRAAQDASRSVVPPEYLDQVCADVWAGQRPTLDIYADCGNHVAPRFFSRFPQPGSSGEALAATWNMERMWAFPTFALTRSTMAKALNSTLSTRQLALLLPDTPTTRATLATWDSCAGPAHLLAPPLFTRRTTPPSHLRLFVSP